MRLATASMSLFILCSQARTTVQPRRFQAQVRFAVSSDVRRQLRHPVCNICLWIGRVFGATMPEATIAEDGDSCAGEDDVRADARTVQAKEDIQRIARQTSGLNLTHWSTARHTGRREEQTVGEDQSARTIGLYVTPAFRIGKTGGRMSIFTGRTMIRYSEQKHPSAPIEAADIANAIELLDNGQANPARKSSEP